MQRAAVRARRQEMGLRAHREPHALGVGDFRQSGNERDLFVVGRIAITEAVRRSRQVQIAFRLLVELGERHDDLVGRAPHFAREPAEVLDVPSLGREVGDQNGVVAPDNATRAPPVRQQPDGRDRPLGADDRMLDVAGIADDAVLHVEGVPQTGNFRQGVDQGSDILGPQHDAIDIARRQGDATGAKVVRIYHPAKSGPQAVQKPTSVERRDIGLVARRNDQRLGLWRVAGLSAIAQASRMGGNRRTMRKQNPYCIHRPQTPVSIRRCYAPTPETSSSSSFPSASCRLKRLFSRFPGRFCGRLLGKPLGFRRGGWRPSSSDGR